MSIHMVSPDYAKAKVAAETLLKKYNIDTPVVPVFEIAQKEGLGINQFDMPDKLQDVAGFFDPETKTIYVNKQEAPTRQAFTVAHELGHYLLNHAQDQVGVLSRWPKKQNGTNDPIEQEANCFAEELLVPTEMLEQQIKHYNLDANSLTILGGLFGVSQSMMEIKLKHVWQQETQIQ